MRIRTSVSQLRFREFFVGIGDHGVLSSRRFATRVPKLSVSRYIRYEE